MGTYAATSNVQARLPYRTIDASSEPNDTQVSGWIDEAEAALEGALAAGQVSVPVTNANGIKQMRAWALDYPVGMTRLAYGATGGESAEDEGTAMIERFWDRVDDILDNPSRYSAMLSGGTAGDSTRGLRSYVTDNADGATISGGDFTPTFEKGRGSKQF